MELKEKVEAYETILEDIVSKNVRSVAEVKSGPDLQGNYRVMSSSGGEVVVKAGFTLGKLKPGTEVILIDNLYIADIISDELKTKQAEVDFKPVNWNDIGGLASQLEEIRETIEGPIRNAKLYAEFGLEPMKGLLLSGPPGVGKTMIAKAIATYILEGSKITKDSFIYVKGGEMLSKYVGDSENSIKLMFERARKNFTRTGSPSVIFIDEAEAIMPARGSRISSDVEKTIVPTFLAEMDGLNQNNPFVILATNHPGSIDEAIIRPGRIDTKLQIGRPTADDAKEILKIYMSKVLCHDDLTELIDLGVNTIYADDKHKTQVSGAFFKNFTQKVTLTALKRYTKDSSIKGISQTDILETIKQL